MIALACALCNACSHASSIQREIEVTPDRDQVLRDASADTLDALLQEPMLLHPDVLAIGIEYARLRMVRRVWTEDEQTFVQGLTRDGLIVLRDPWGRITTRRARPNETPDDYFWALPRGYRAVRERVILDHP